LLYQKSTRAIGGFSGEDEWIRGTSITKSEITNTVYAFIFPNSIYPHTLGSSENVSTAYAAHEATIIATEQRDLPFSTQSKGDTEFVAKLPKVFPPTIGSHSKILELIPTSIWKTSKLCCNIQPVAVG
jgi:hypothetical protein